MFGHVKVLLSCYDNTIFQKYLNISSLHSVTIVRQLYEENPLWVMAIFLNKKVKVEAIRRPKTISIVKGVLHPP